MTIMSGEDKAIAALTDAIKTAEPHIDALFDRLVNQRDPAAHALLIDLLRASNAMTAYVGCAAMVEFFITTKAA